MNFFFFGFWSSLRSSWNQKLSLNKFASTSPSTSTRLLFKNLHPLLLPLARLLFLHPKVLPENSWKRLDAVLDIKGFWFSTEDPLARRVGWSPWYQREAGIPILNWVGVFSWKFGNSPKIRERDSDRCPGLRFVSRRYLLLRKLY